MLEDEDLRRLGAACAELALLTGGSGIAMGLPENFRRAGLLQAGAGRRRCCPRSTGAEVVLAGSCSAATLEQVAAMAAVPSGAAARPRAAGGRLAAGRGRGLGARSDWATARC